MSTKLNLESPSTFEVPVAPNKKELPLILPPKASKALLQLRKSFEKLQSLKDLEPVFAAVKVWMRIERKQITWGENAPNAVDIPDFGEGELEQLISNLLIFCGEISRTIPKNLTKPSLAKELYEKKITNEAASCILDLFFLERWVVHLGPGTSSLLLLTLFLCCSVGMTFLLMVCIFSSFIQQDHKILALPSSTRFRKIEWRLDVIITSHTGKRLLEPLFLVSFADSEKNVVFEMSVLQFHKMRFAVADLLNEMQILENRKAISI